MKLNIELDLENDAFKDHLFLEIERILKAVTARLWEIELWGIEEKDGELKALLDINGNRVGRAWFTETEDLK